MGLTPTSARVRVRLVCAPVVAHTLVSRLGGILSCVSCECAASHALLAASPHIACSIPHPPISTARATELGVRSHRRVF